MALILTNELSGLHSSSTTLRLEQIANLRANGTGDHIDLPQLVVCGDQSTGKSSILEGITGLPFPRRDGLCTKFATEIILQHTNNEWMIVATILPSQHRSDSRKSELQLYRRQFESFDDLPRVIKEAGKLMNVKGFGGVQDGPSFAEDVLRIEVSGSVGLHLSVVDLPGLISVPNEEQTEDDVQTVHQLVDSYLSNSRTIILAVVQAGNDIANQPIIQKARLTEKRIALLAKNQDSTKLKLGFFIVKNPTPQELANGITSKERETIETRYFNSPPWEEQNLDPNRVGISSLRIYIQILLDRHIEQELPKVREEINNLLTRTKYDMSALGEERVTLGEFRIFLSRLSIKFHQLVTSALNGIYHEADAVFFERQGMSKSTRLRAVVHQMNTNFSDYMRQNGQQRRVIKQPDHESEEDETRDLEELGQILATESEMKEWVKEIYTISRGKELPGNYNHILLSELFHIQSGRWKDIAKDHLIRVHNEIGSFVIAGLHHITRDDRVFSELAELTGTRLKENRISAEDELDSLWNDEQQQPLTYNHYYTDNIQKARQDSTRKLIQKAMSDAITMDYNGRLHVSHNTVDSERLLASLQKRIIIDMDDQACTEALDGLMAYVKVARKTFVDNVCRQVIERHLLRKLPAIFDPETVASFDESILQRIADESEGIREQRKRLRNLQAALERGLQDLHR